MEVEDAQGKRSCGSTGSGSDRLPVLQDGSFSAADRGAARFLAQLHTVDRERPVEGRLAAQSHSQPDVHDGGLTGPGGDLQAPFSRMHGLKGKPEMAKGYWVALADVSD